MYKYPWNPANVSARPAYSLTGSHRIGICHDLVKCWWRPTHQHAAPPPPALKQQHPQLNDPMADCRLLAFSVESPIELC